LSFAELDAIVFDLDGTLWDTTEACAIGWNRVLARHRIPFRSVTAGDIRSVVGKPHEACIRDVCHALSEHHLRILIDETPEEDNRAVAELGGKVYPGVEPGLARLSRLYPLFIVSNCQAGYIETFLRCTGFGGLFRDFECWGNTGLTKAENLRAIVGRNRLSSPLFVGDTEGDRMAAESCSLPFVHASYGFGECATPTRVESFADLVKLVCGD
jgi:phosphoglycolate phosphatase